MTSQDTKPIRECPYCGEAAWADSFYCPHCGKRILIHGGEDLENTTSVEDQAYGQAPWRLGILCVATLGLYGYYWFYRNWKHLKTHLNLPISPGWRTVSLLFPIYSIYVIWTHFNMIKRYVGGAEPAVRWSPPALTLGYVMLSYIASWNLSRTFGDRIPSEIAISLVGVIVAISLAAWLLTLVQDSLNGFWLRARPQFPMASEFSGFEMACLVCGGFWWGLALIGIVVKMIPASPSP
ncbi:hypothetical protein ACFL2Q_07645 [Thermodesulfobacteriota bacterium]